MRELYNGNEFYLKKKYGSELNYELWLFGGFSRLLVENLFIYLFIYLLGSSKYK